MPEIEQTTEVRETTARPDGRQVERQSVQHTGQASGTTILTRFVWFVVGVINTLIAIRFVLLLLGANQSSGFVDFIYAVTSALVAPFTGIFGEPVFGSFVFEWSSLLAIAVYSLIAWGIAKLLTLTKPRQTI